MQNQFLPVIVSELTSFLPDTPSSPAKIPIFTTLEPYLDEVNSHIHANAQANSVRVAAVHQAFNGADGTQDPGMLGLIADDGFHPNDAGHKVIADQLRTLGYAPLH